MSKLMHCPTCQREHQPEAGANHRPFCSERCKVIDLGRWLTEDYRIPAEEITSESFSRPEATSEPSLQAQTSFSDKSVN